MTRRRYGAPASLFKLTGAPARRASWHTLVDFGAVLSQASPAAPLAFPTTIQRAGVDSLLDSLCYFDRPADVLVRRLTGERSRAACTRMALRVTLSFRHPVSLMVAHMELMATPRSSSCVRSWSRPLLKRSCREARQYCCTTTPTTALT